MSALQTPDWRTANLHVLVKLACSPDPHTAYTDHTWVRPVQEAVRGVREGLVSAHARGDQTLPVTTMSGWCTSVQRALTDAAVSVPERWQVWFEPGSWLECNVRLARVLAELAAECEGDEVPLSQMNVLARLGWPAWTLPRLPTPEAVR
jgi:hypothetical protein